MGAWPRRLLVAIDGLNRPSIIVLGGPVVEPRAACSIQRSGPGSRRIGMAGRRFLLAVVLLAAVLPGGSTARSRPRAGPPQAGRPRAGNGVRPSRSSLTLGQNVELA